MPAIFWFFIAFLLLGTALMIISPIVANKKLMHDIKPLWENKRPLENFIRPNHTYSYQFDTYKHKFNSATLIDEKTWSDLNLDSVFHNMNFNFTAIGEMRLFATLKNMFQVTDAKLLSDITANIDFRNKISLYLAQIGKAIYPTFPDQISSIKRNNFFMLCTYLPLIFIILSIFTPSIGISLTIVSAIFNMILSGFLKKTYEQDLNSMFYTSTVIKKAYAIQQLELAPNLDVDFKHFVTARKFSGLLGRVNSNDETSVFSLLFKLIFMMDYHLFHLIQNSFKKYEDEVMACYEYIANIDNHYAVALWRETLDHYTVPQVTEKDVIHFKQLTHPLINGAVPNDLAIDNHILLTGSNASGKSTFMKAVALNIVLSQTINTATAKEFEYKPGMVYTSMVNQDDILTGDSYFMTEIKSIKRLFDITTTNKVYCFIDEIFKGTNTTERIAASESVLSYLDQLEGYTVIAATHDIELSSLLGNVYSNYHFNESITEDNISFDFKIKQGKADTRNAIELLRIMSFPKKIYNRAKSSANHNT
ncbi:MutS-related protein [Staphylococcus xylosus]|uniref:MutS family DNA mismatch repair protein n=2 Tax=Staphylococcus TaxID=1279 RepID=A0AAQ0LWU3_STAXY|nr:MutS family DNA mismatch repair protein [Staphylococcus xylosus]RIM64937.1 MutS family DNA mismatch repair protein [Staphylococcus xylosus]RIM91426.1 MutS family DNA mismatch repair protein [Staphylococcus xylosus]